MSALSQALAMARPDVDPRDARRLLAHVLSVTPDRLIMLDDAQFTEGALAEFNAALTRRRAGEPVSHILGYREFYAHRFIVNADVLDPRPETEVLVGAALDRPFDRVLDLGTGSGAILISLLAARPEATGVGVDMSELALTVASRNAVAIGVADRTELRTSDWFSSVSGTFDLIVSNPPYIAADEMPDLAPELAFEPQMALTDGADGLTAYRAITAEATAYLAPGGALMVEIGPTQGAAVMALFEAAGLTRVTCLTDIDGRDRVITGIAPKNAANAPL